MQLAETATLIRSKNAGPFQLTFDVMFDDDESYHAAASAGVITADVVAALYNCAPGDVRVFHCPNARAIKVTIPRPNVQGNFGDPALHGGQQYAPLMALQLP